MPYGPDVALADIISDEEALSVVRRHLPGVLDEPELRLLPFGFMKESRVDLSIVVGRCRFTAVRWNERPYMELDHLRRRR